jgi:ABC-2 type transport system permease protein
MKTLWLMYKTEMKLSYREFSAVLFGVLMPVGLMLLLGVLYGGSVAEEGSAIRRVDMSFGAVASIGICAAGLMGLPIALSDYRWRKVLKRYKVTPVSPGTLLSAHVLYSFTLSIASTILVYLICALFFGFGLHGSPFTFILVYLLVLVSIHAIGMAIAGMAKSAQMGGILASAFYFPMLFLSGATIPYEIMPKALQTAADFLPLTQGIKLLKAASLGQDLHAMTLSFAVLAVIAVLGTFLSLKFFRWE